MSCRSDELKRTAKAVMQKAMAAGKAPLKWCKDNPDAVGLIVSGLGIGALAVACSVIDANDRKHNRATFRRIKDYESGETLYLRRELNGIDITRLSGRLKDGKSLSEALQDMDLIK